MKSITKLAATLALATTLTLTACEEKEAAKPTTEPASGSIKSVKIGTQTWMAENLNIETTGSKCYDNNPDNCKKYGRLYDWNTAMKACPSGWHLPSKAEWQTLVDFAGGDNAGKMLKASNGWNGYCDDDDEDCKVPKSGNGIDKFGFSALPGGHYGIDGEYSDTNTNFYRITEHGFWWSSSEDGNNCYISHNSESIDCGGGGDKSRFLSVRCIKD